MSSSRKKVIVRRFVGDLICGYLPLAAFVRGSGGSQMLDLLDLSGHIVELPLKDVKTVSFVRDFNPGDSTNPERLIRKAFLARPRSEGLWVRLTFRSGDMLEGLAAPDLSFIDAIVEDSGLHMAPPDIRSNTQHIFVPRSAIAEFQILAVISSPSKPKAAPKRTPEQIRKELQESLFDSPTPPNTRPN